MSSNLSAAVITDRQHQHIARSGRTYLIVDSTINRRRLEPNIVPSFTITASRTFIQDHSEYQTKRLQFSVLNLALLAALPDGRERWRWLLGGCAVAQQFSALVSIYAD